MKIFQKITSIPELEGLSKEHRQRLIRECEPGLILTVVGISSAVVMGIVYALASATIPSSVGKKTREWISWGLAGVSAAMASAAVQHFFAVPLFQRRVRSWLALCTRCGYDLRESGTESGGTCPECGSHFKRKQGKTFFSKHPVKVVQVDEDADWGNE